MSQENDLVVVYAGNVAEAGFVRTLLEGNEIPAFLKDEVVGTLFPWCAASGGAGAVKVVVARRDLEEAASLVQGFLDEEADN